MLAFWQEFWPFAVWPFMAGLVTAILAHYLPRLFYLAYKLLLK